LIEVVLEEGEEINGVEAEAVEEAEDTPQN